jgi:hypothetical protein
MLVGAGGGVCWADAADAHTVAVASASVLNWKVMTDVST